MKFGFAAALSFAVAIAACIGLTTPASARNQAALEGIFAKALWLDRNCDGVDLDETTAASIAASLGVDLDALTSNGLFRGVAYSVTSIIEQDARQNGLYLTCHRTMDQLSGMVRMADLHAQMNAALSINSPMVPDSDLSSDQRFIARTIYWGMSAQEICPPASPDMILAERLMDNAGLRDHPSLDVFLAGLSRDMIQIAGTLGRPHLCNMLIDEVTRPVYVDGGQYSLMPTTAEHQFPAK
ncbi:MAG: hypothetical protein AAFR17_19335 [Pseudomonadota bacterium]